MATELEQIQQTLEEMQRQFKSLEEVVKTRRDDERKLREQLKTITDILEGSDGKPGMKDCVERLVMLIDGDDAYNVMGFRKRIDIVEKKVDELITQRNMLKWALIGMGVAGLGNTGALLTILAKVVGVP